MNKARLVLHTKYLDEHGGLIEMKAYQVPKSDVTPDGYKYSLVYIRKGRRLVGYDNHERKGDHRHYEGQTTPYRFTSVEQLIADFLHDVATVKKEKEI
ncbi:MAG: toxin-antitoxin system TumE family protein [Nitrospiraceae bacterium]